MENTHKEIILRNYTDRKNFLMSLRIYFELYDYTSHDTITPLDLLLYMLNTNIWIQDTISYLKSTVIDNHTEILSVSHFVNIHFVIREKTCIFMSFIYKNSNDLLYDKLYLHVKFQDFPNISICSMKLFAYEKPVCSSFGNS